MFESLKCTLGRHSWGAWETERGAPCKTVRYCQICQTKEVGFDRHTFGEWVRTVSEDTCAEERRCMRCGHLETREAEHTWTEWFQEHADSPSEKRTCQDCGRSELRIGDYQWAEVASVPVTAVPAHDQPTAAALTQITENFSEPSPEQLPPDAVAEEHAGLDMPMPPIAEVEPTAVVPGKNSSRKKQKKLTAQPTTDACETHSWGEWHPTTESACQLIRECTKCGTRDTEIMAAKHDLSWRQAQLPGPACAWVQQCRWCGHIEAREARHAFVWASKPGDPCTQEFRCEHCGYIGETQTTHQWFLSFRSERGTEHYTCEVCHKTRVS